ncbi:hypothetical protein K490DRAFT_54604 [Saccharata proteae CBS 121410]|uniref:Uncharacterized protein n=1 Tax=Saccharata proteae CBS 121410 TaxID=1314787 RepID=A0A9P4LX40_9PEZI|nr:hypothetical protein K490DRAFT_54604 [Saccharata proteae CBS 121410]
MLTLCQRCALDGTVDYRTKVPRWTNESKKPSCKIETMRIILKKDGSNFRSWRMGLIGKLAKPGLIGYIFHDIEEIRPVHEPTKPDASSTITDEEYAAEAQKWYLNNIFAWEILYLRLDESLQFFCADETATAKEIYDRIARIYGPIELLGDGRI